jgi:hypothetical protein
MGETGNNYNISKKFREICLVLSDKNFGNQRIRISKKIYSLIRMMFFWIVFQEPILPGKAKTNQSGSFPV